MAVPHDHHAWGWGLASITRAGAVLDTWFPDPRLGLPDAGGAPEQLNALATDQPDPIRQVHRELVRVAIDLGAAPADVPDAYLRLHLLSHCLRQPRTINLDGIFAVLPNVVWTNLGPCASTDFEAVRARALLAEAGLTITGVDKFPRLVDYWIPPEVRIGDANRVRLGAHLAPGTTVMHEGFVNYNAGTLGVSMVEGRISQGVIVGPGSDIGGGASIMGTLSGGGQEHISIGSGCLLGAEAGIGISLGDNCVVEAGLYVTSGTKVTLPDGTVAKAHQLSGHSDLLFLRDSVSGAVLAKPRTSDQIQLNAALHQN